MVRNITMLGRGKLFGRVGVLAMLCAGTMLLAMQAMGCGSSSNTQILPFAGVWVANSGGANVLHFTGTEAQLSGNLNIAPKTFLNSGVFVSPQDTLFDSNDSLWVVDGGLNDGLGTGAAVYKFVGAQLSSLNSQPAPAPSFIIKALTGASTFNFPQFAAFDNKGDLWVSDAGNSLLFEFTASQLAAASGVAIAPFAVLTSVAFNGPLGMAFDGSNNLWILNNGGTTIVEVTAAQLAAATGLTSIVPATVLASAAIPGGLPTINNPWGIVFDGSGNMWITNEQLSVSNHSGSVVEFTAASIAGGGILTPLPNVVITQNAVAGTLSLFDPNGIGMNAAGNIVVANAGNNSVALYTPDQTGSSGSPVPHLFLSGGTTTLNAPTGLVYGPLSLQ
jgi:hypothetical protein